MELTEKSKEKLEKDQKQKNKKITTKNSGMMQKIL